MGIVFRKPQPFPETIDEPEPIDEIDACDLRIQGINNRRVLDDPTSAAISILKIEERIYELKCRYSIVFTTHNRQPIAAVSDYTVFMYPGRLIKFGSTDRLFTHPEKKQTEDCIRGRYG